MTSGARCCKSSAWAGVTRSRSTPPEPTDSGQATAASSAPAIAGHAALIRAVTPPPLLATIGPARREAAIPIACSPGARSPGSRGRSGTARLGSASRRVRPMPDPDVLLIWYDRHRRDLPWRAPPGRRPDPYRVWLSEIMLQQTTVYTVGPYFDRFVARWPDVFALAAASLDDILVEWQGLGYYARARNLHRCARAVAEGHGGVFPDTVEGLRELPGIGAYTAAAIAAIAFDRRAAAVDGNVERVVARLYAVTEPLPGCKPRLRALAEALVPPRRAGDFAQAA